MDLLKHPVEPTEHVVICATNKPDTYRLNARLPSCVALLSSVAKVRVTVQLDSKLSGGTVEIDDVGTESVLSTELESAQLLSAES